MAGAMALRRATVATVALLMVVVLVFFAIRLAVDLPHLLGGTTPAERSFERRYVEHAGPAYLHIVPGVVFLLGAPLQMSRRLRMRNLRAHRSRGRVLVACGLISGVFAFIFGVPRAFGGAPEAAATLVFGTWFVCCLLAGLLAAVRRDIVAHRRWMIRAFAVGLAVGTIRLWIGAFLGLGVLDFRDSFGVAFWVAFVLHVAGAEWWLARAPSAGARRTTAPAPRHRPK